MGRASCDDHAAFPQQTAADSTQRYRWSSGSETSTTLQQPIPNSTVRADCFYYPICRLICINKCSVVFVSSYRFCLWPRCLNHSMHSFCPGEPQNKTNPDIASRFGLVLFIGSQCLTWDKYTQATRKSWRWHTKHKLRTKWSVLSIIQIQSRCPSVIYIFWTFFCFIVTCHPPLCLLCKLTVGGHCALFHIQ